jgi:hypothetical protein
MRNSKQYKLQCCMACGDENPEHSIKKHGVNRLKGTSVTLDRSAAEHQTPAAPAAAVVACWCMHGLTKLLSKFTYVPSMPNKPSTNLTYVPLHELGISNDPPGVAHAADGHAQQALSNCSSCTRATHT